MTAPATARAASGPRPSTRPSLRSRALLALALLSVAAAPARADATPPVDLRPEVRVQRRFVEKKGHFAVFAGFAYLARGDFYYSPGVELVGCYYLLESLALELRGTLFFSSPTDELKQVLTATGYLPDSRESRGSVMVGARYTVGYAKVKLGASTVLHLEPQVFADLGVHIASGPYTDVLPGPMGELGLGLLLFITPRLQARIDAGLTVGGEQRTRYVAVVGGFPVLTLGMMF